MNNSVQKRLIHAQSKVETLSYLLAQLKELDIRSAFCEYSIQSCEAAHAAEVLACGIRELVIDSTFADRRLFMDTVAALQGITIQRHEAWYEIGIPALLPKKKAATSSSFIVDPLTRVLDKYVLEHHPERLRESVVCFRYVYTEDMPERIVRDHDNIEAKKVLDVIADRLLIDDTGRLCSNLYTSAAGKSERTEIFVMEPETLPYWLKSYPIKWP